MWGYLYCLKSISSKQKATSFWFRTAMIYSPSESCDGAAEHHYQHWQVGCSHLNEKNLIWIGGTALFCSHINNLLEPSRSTFGKAWNENIGRSDFELPDLVHGARCHAVLVQNATSVLHQTQIVAPVVFILDQGNTQHFKLLKLDFPKFGHYSSYFFVFKIHRF